MVLYNSGFQFIVWSECATKSAGKKWVLCRSVNVRDANVQSQSEKHNNPAHSAHSKILAKLFNILIFEWRAGSSSLLVNQGSREKSKSDGWSTGLRVTQSEHEGGKGRGLWVACSVIEESALVISSYEILGYLSIHYFDMFGFLFCLCFL